MASLLVGCASSQPRVASQQSYEYITSVGGAYDYCTENNLISQDLAGKVLYHSKAYLQHASYDQEKLNRMAFEKSREMTAADCPSLQAFVTQRENIRQANNRMAEQQRQQIQQATQAMQQDQASCNTVGGRTFCTQY